MSAQLNDFVPLTIFISSVLGSWHCAGMCGAIACSASLKGRSHLYHLGRMISYVTLGGLAGLLGEHILNSELLFMQKISAFLMGAVLIMIGMSFLANWKMQSQQGLQFFLPLLKKNKDQQLFLGLLTGLLPVDGFTPSSQLQSQRKVR